MSNNPFQSPEQNPGQPYQQFQGVGPDVSGKVSGPAIALMVVAVINIILAILGLLQHILIMSGVFDIAEMQKQMQDAGMEQEFIDIMTQSMLAQGPMGIVTNALTLICGIIIFVGAMKMKNLTSYGMAMTASIVSMIPCVSCCCIGLPIGIWSLVILNDMHVKNAFRAKK